MSAAGAAAPNAELEDDYELVTRPCGRGCVSTKIKSLHFQLRTFLHVLKERLFHNFPCACCDHRLYYYYDTCQHCRAPVCIECASFIKKYECAKGKRCRWCGSVASPLKENDFEDGNPKDIDFAIQRFVSLGDWFRGIIHIDPQFDFSKIIWQEYFEALEWRFYVDANHFFTVELPNQCDIMMANMIFHHSFHMTHFKYQNNSKKFAPFLRRFNSDEKPYLFFQLRQMALMHTMLVMMLEMMVTPFFDPVLRRVHATRSLQLSNGLGVRLPKCQESEEPEDNSWMWK